jgi:hypothetical protein
MRTGNVVATGRVTLIEPASGAVEVSVAVPVDIIASY